jgi:hypothetical protein
VARALGLKDDWLEQHPPGPRRLVGTAAARGTTLLLMAPGMSRRKRNTSRVRHWNLEGTARGVSWDDCGCGGIKLRSYARQHVLIMTFFWYDDERFSLAGHHSEACLREIVGLANSSRLVPLSASGAGSRAEACVACGVGLCRCRRACETERGRLGGGQATDRRAGITPRPFHCEFCWSLVLP